MYWLEELPWKTRAGTKNSPLLAALAKHSQSPVFSRTCQNHAVTAAWGGSLTSRSWCPPAALVPAGLERHTHTPSASPGPARPPPPPPGPVPASQRGGPLGHLPAPAAPGLRRPPGTIRPASAPSRPLLVPHSARRNAPGAPHPPAARWRGQLPPGPGPVPPRPRSPLWLRTKMAAKGRTPRAACRDTLREGPHRRAAPIEPE